MLVVSNQRGYKLDVYILTCINPLSTGVFHEIRFGWFTRGPFPAFPVILHRASHRNPRPGRVRSRIPKLDLSVLTVYRPFRSLAAPKPGPSQMGSVLRTAVRPALRRCRLHALTRVHCPAPLVSGARLNCSLILIPLGHEPSADMNPGVVTANPDA
jgi:hypothetical protein